MTVRRLPWDSAVAAGVVADTEVLRLSACVGTDDDGVWRVDLTGLTDAERERLERAIRWFCGREVLR